MKVLVNSVNITLDGPESGYLNVYSLHDQNGRVRYVTGAKAYASEGEAQRKARPAPGWTRHGVVAVQHYRNHVNAHNADYIAALRVHVINDLDTFLSRVVNQQAPTGLPGGLNTAPAQDEAPVTEAPPLKGKKATSKPRTVTGVAKAGKKVVKASKGAKAKKAASKKPAKRSTSL